MTYVGATVDIAASAESVWAKVGGFGTLADWLPVISASDLLDGGRARRVSTDAGVVAIERLVSYDEADRCYSYVMVDGPLPVADYRGTLRVQPIGDGMSSRLEWSAGFTPVGISEPEATQLIQGIFESGLGSFAATF
jgi:Polyketide cyclase / dehydrase and lipid transport